MKKIGLKIFSSILLVFVSLIPIFNVNAATPTQTAIEKSLSDISNGKGIDKTYYMGPSQPYYQGSNWYFHQIKDDNGNIYLAYCLNHGKSAPTEGGKINSGISSLGYSSKKEQLLKNILAAGQHHSGSLNSFFNDEKKVYRAMATQILMWEVISDGRTNYDEEPDKLVLYKKDNSGIKISYDFVELNRELLNQYKSILSTAESLTKEPAFNNKNYVMHWNDNESEYALSSAINIGKYKRYSNSFVDELNYEETNTTIMVSTNNYFSGKKKVELRYAVGSTSVNDFMWFKFSAPSDSKQNFALAEYGETKSASFNVSVEKGKFRLAKFDEDNKLLKGAVFEISKCSSTVANDCEVIDTVDLTKKAYKDIEIVKSGKYLFKETKVPFGYEKINDFFVDFKIDNDGNVTAKANYDFLSIDSETVKGNPILRLCISNEAKSFSIKKIDGTTKGEIKGAGFKIKNSSGEVIKFIDDNGSYKYSKDGDIETLKNSNLSIYNVKLLPQGEYILEETEVPYPYTLSSKQSERETKFKIDSDANLLTYNYSTNNYSKSVDVSITVNNFKTKIIVEKIGNGGEPLEGVIFELYDSNKTNQIALKNMINDEYEYNKDSSAMPINIVTKSNGKAVINYLPEGTYWLKEIQTIEGYVIDPSVEWTSFTVSIKRNSATNGQTKDSQVKISNEKSQFCFYKMDEDGNYLTNGKFKLQFYNEKVSKFEDVPLLYQNTEKAYKIDFEYNSDVYIFTPLSSGQTCFIDVPAKSRYRVVEIEAPKGFILPNSNEAQAELIMNENGYAIGAPILINKKITVGEGAEAQAELIINIQTGQNRIHYLVILSVLLVGIAILFTLKKKMNKK